MNRIELLAPAGNMECLKASVMAGCDAVYLGGNHFGARAFSKNFSDEEIIEEVIKKEQYKRSEFYTSKSLLKLSSISLPSSKVLIL